MQSKKTNNQTEKPTESTKSSQAQEQKAEMPSLSDVKYFHTRCSQGRTKSSRDLQTPPLFILNSSSLRPTQLQARKTKGKSPCRYLPSRQEHSMFQSLFQNLHHRRFTVHQCFYNTRNADQPLTALALQLEQGRLCVMALLGSSCSTAR